MVEPTRAAARIACAAPRGLAPHAVLWAGLLLAAGAGFAESSVLETYRALRAPRLDGRTIAVSGLTLTRGDLSLRFDGTFHLLAPVALQGFGAVFLGRAELRLEPTTEMERAHLALRLRDPRFEVLTDSFTELVLLFADRTEEELLAGAAAPGSGAVAAPGSGARAAPGSGAVADPRAAKLLEQALESQRERLRSNLQLRLLRAVTNQAAAAGGPFVAFGRGARLGEVLLAHDPLGCDELLQTHFSREHTFVLVADPQKGGYWYSSDPASASAHRWGNALTYAIELDIAGDNALAGKTTIKFITEAPKLQVLPLRLMPRLRLTAASYQPPLASAPVAVEFVQEDHRHDADAAVIFPEPVVRGDLVELHLTYEGKEVLENAGDENYFVNARSSWYPNLGTFTDVAAYQLTFTLPADREVVAVGDQSENVVQGSRRTQRFATALPVRVAGFNYGRFKKLDRLDEATGFNVSVFTNPGRPEFLDLLDRALGGGVPQIPLGDGGAGAISSARSPEENERQFGRGLVGRVDTAALAESALVDGLNAARIGTAYFGPLQINRVAITQQSQWNFGQSWPTLIYLPYLAFLSGTHRAQLLQLDLKYVSDASLEQLGYHEFAHQWWGHQVGWASYRDQWLSEGFAEFSAALTAQHAGGWEASDTFWQQARARVLGKPRGGRGDFASAGPILLGTRLETADTPGAYSAIVYAKGAYVLHMLRMTMWDGAAAEPDHRFMAMMADFAKSHAGKSPTTLDFQRTVERHLVPQLDLRGDGKLDWFFAQWVAGTEIPTVRGELSVKPEGEAFLITGSLRQEDVAESFLSFLPLYADFGKEGMARLGGVRLAGTAPTPLELRVRLPKKPKAITWNVHYDWLTRN